MAHSIRIDPAPRKFINNLDAQNSRRITQAIHKLSLIPRPIGCKKLKNRDAYRIRVGDYRVIYEIYDDVLVVLVVRIAHRREVYQ